MALFVFSRNETEGLFSLWFVDHDESIHIQDIKGDLLIFDSLMPSIHLTDCTESKKLCMDLYCMNARALLTSALVLFSFSILKISQGSNNQTVVV